jgi:hypothetical protein
MDNQSKKIIGAHLWEMWLRLNLDKPTNWHEIVDFVIDDVECASNYLYNGDFHTGDVEIGFRRYIESKSFAQY